MTMYQATAEIDHPERVSGRFHHMRGGMFAYNGFQPNRVIMMDFSGPPEDRQAPVTHEEIEAMLPCV